MCDHRLMHWRSRSSRHARLGAALLVVAGLTGAFSLALSAGTAAHAATANPYQVTFVARECPEYTDIMANLARNNIQESQQDLGPDSAYRSGQPIAPAIESANDPACTPLNGWQFTFGNGINGQTPGSHLSRVSNPVSPPITVQPSVPLLDAQGNPTGQSIAAATTVTLTQSQITAALNHQLWVQGGTPTDPLGTATFGNRYAFGALRCAIDNLNGDNVEWVGFPSGQTNVFCYYYAVDQTPAPGTIVVQKQLAVGEPEANTFQFQGNVSYNPGATPSPDDNPFEITVPASASSPSVPAGSISFVRSSGVSWSFTELPNPGWAAPAPPTCSGGPTTIVGAQVTLTLAPGSTVTCTYTDSRPDPPSNPTLTVLKQTTGAAGGPFNLSVTDPSATVTPLVATTAAPDQPVAATLAGGTAFAPILVPGVYTFSEDLSSVNAAAGEHWALTNFNCDGEPGTPVPGDPTAFTFTYPPTNPLPAPGDSLECTFTNQVTPAGSLSVTKTTTGGVGTTDFVVTPVADPTDTTVPGDTTDPVLTATTTEAGVPVTAAQTAGSPLNPLALGQYSIVEEGPESSTLGAWAPVSISCNGAATDPTASDVLVTLTAADPDVACAFTNAFTATQQTTTSSTAAPTPAAVPVVPSLASTGTDVRLPLALAVALASAGSALLVIDRFRRRRRPTALRRDHDPPG
jgi:hypothetical protein